MNEGELKRLFDNSNTHIDDDGFSDDIIAKLPKRRKTYLWIQMLFFLLTLIIGLFATTMTIDNLYSWLNASFVIEYGLITAGILTAIALSWYFFTESDC
ncbi:MAG: DUF5056 domain-containing protein [Francisellaceae bacterium]